MGKDNKSTQPTAPAANTAKAAEGSREARTSGRVGFDSRGDAVWQWRQEDGHFRPEASTTRVQKLEAAELSLEPTMKVAQLAPPTPTQTELPCGGFNPYDRGALVAPTEDAAPVPKTKFPPIVAPPVDNRLSARLRRWFRS
jgi:hypothetical protein